MGYWSWTDDAGAPPLVGISETTHSQTRFRHSHRGFWFIFYLLMEVFRGRN